MNSSELTDNKVIIEEYGRFRLEAENISPNTIENQWFILTKFSNHLNKPFKEAAEKDVLEFLIMYKDSTRDNIIATLRKFYKKLFDLDNGDKLPKCIRNIRPVGKKKRDDINYRERVITEDEYQRLLDHARTPMHKAMIETLYLFGVRASELLSMNATDAVYDGEFTKITVRESKTKTREVPYRGRANLLMAYVESYQPFKGQKGKPLWVGQNNGKFSQRGMLNLMERTSRYAGLDRRVNNHDFRHTSISRDRANGVPDTFIEIKHGLVHGSLMMSVYDHNKTKGYEEYLQGKGGKTEQTYETLKQQKEQLEQEKDNEISQLKSKVDMMTNMMQQITDKIGIELEEKIEEKKERKEAYKEYQRTVHPSEKRLLPDQIKKEIENAGSLKSWSKKKLAEHKAKTKGEV